MNSLCWVSACIMTFFLGYLVAPIFLEYLPCIFYFNCVPSASPPLPPPLPFYTNLSIRSTCHWPYIEYVTYFQISLWARKISPSAPVSIPNDLFIYINMIKLIDSIHFGLASHLDVQHCFCSMRPLLLSWSLTLQT